MNWTAALEAMRKGKHIQRTSQQGRKLIGHSGGLPIYECGEATRLAYAWTHDNKPVLVFQGTESKVLFVPETDDRNANDWEVVR